MDTIPLKNQVAVHHNDIIESSYMMTLNEKRLLLLGISKIDSRKKLDKITITVTVEEWEEWFPGSNAYRDIKAASESLQTRYVRLHPKTNVTKKVNWVDYSVYNDGTGKVEIVIGREMEKYLQNLWGDFTKIDLLAVRKMSSVYGVRLYELARKMLFRKRPEEVYSIDDFRFVMNCQDTYPEVKELKRAVIKPALKEINNKSDLKVSITDVKQGRKITGFLLRIDQSDQLEMFR
jgi:plasmid replication initiation protein